MTFTGDVRFKTLLASVLTKNELNGASAYELLWAGNSNSGWSFGVPQYDLSTKKQEGIDLFIKILRNAKNGSNYIIDDGDPLTGRTNDRKVADLLAKAKMKGGTSLNTEELGLINQALSSTYGRSAIDGALDGTLQNLINDATRATNLTSGDDKTFLQSDLGKLFLCDYDNQLDITPGGLLEKFIQGIPVPTVGGTITKQGVLGVDDLLALYFRTEWAQKAPWDPMRRFSNVAEAAGFTEDGLDLDTAKGILRAYTYLYVRNENILLQTQGRIDSVNAFRDIVTNPANQVILSNWNPEWGQCPSISNINDILMGDDKDNMSTGGEYQLNGRDGNDVIFGEGGDDLIWGGADNDTLIGGTGDDMLIGGIGDDILMGGENDDTYIKENRGQTATFNKTVNDGEGVGVSRSLRIEYPGAFFHVTSRGNERGTVFQGNRDIGKYLSYLESAHERYGAVIHVY